MGADTRAGSKPGSGVRIGGRAGDGDGLSSGVRARARSCSGAGLFELQLNSCCQGGHSSTDGASPSPSGLWPWS